MPDEEEMSGDELYALAASLPKLVKTGGPLVAARATKRLLAALAHYYSYRDAMVISAVEKAIRGVASADPGLAADLAYEALLLTDSQWRYWRSEAGRQRRQGSKLYSPTAKRFKGHRDLFDSLYHYYLGAVEEQGNGAGLVEILVTQMNRGELDPADLMARYGGRLDAAALKEIIERIIGPRYLTLFADLLGEYPDLAVIARRRGDVLRAEFFGSQSDGGPQGKERGQTRE